MRNKFAIGVLLFLSCIFIASCDIGRRPYKEAEALFNQSDYSAAKSKAAELIQTFPESKYIPIANTLIEKVNKIETSLKMAEQAEQKQDYKNAMMYYKEILAIAPKSSKAFEAIKHIEDIESMFSDLKSMAFINLSESDIMTKFGRPDRVVRFGPSEVRFIYGETREGFISWNTYRLTKSFMVTFKKGKAVQLTKSFYGIVKYDDTLRRGDDGGIQDIKGFPKLGEYITPKMKDVKPVIEKKAGWAGITWKNSEYEYWARVITKDIIYNKEKNRFERKEISNIEDYYLAMYEITTRK